MNIDARRRLGRMEQQINRLQETITRGAEHAQKKHEEVSCTHVSVATVVDSVLMAPVLLCSGFQTPCVGREPFSPP